MAATPLYVPVMEAQSWFSISRVTIYRAAQKSEITIYKAGNRALLKVAEISDWIEDAEEK